MKFFINGPEIPDELIRKIEQGKVIPFCGAGLGYEFGLCDFDGLTNKIRKDTATDSIMPDGIPKEEFDVEKNKYKNPAVFLNYLAKYLGSDGYKKIKKAAIEILNLDDKKDVKCESHKAVLKLASQYGSTVVTTNFDHGFLIAKEQLNMNGFSVEQAPALSPAKKGFLPNLVFLHGVINKIHDPDGNRLVLTSKDFGAAYLVNNWAAKFLIELFSNYTILFIGYSINDPIIPYLVDTLSHENTLDAYIFAGYSNSENPKEIEKFWKFRGIKPILYSNNDGHKFFHETLKEMPEKINAQGRKYYISQYAKSDPDKIDNDFRKQVVWSINGQDSDIIDYFVEQNPPIKWLQYFDKYGLLSCENKCNERCYTNIESLSSKYVVSQFCGKSDFNFLTGRLLPWIVNNLDKQELLDYVLEQGCFLKSRFRRVIQDKLQKEFERNGKFSGIYKIWEILTNQQEILWQKENNFPELFTYKKHGNIEHSIKLLTPYLKITPVRDSWRNENFCDKLGDDIQRYASFEIILPGFGEIYSSLNQIQEALAPLLSDKNVLQENVMQFTLLLKRVYDLRSLYTDIQSHYIRPAIIDHKQNAYHDVWTCLVDILRESFLVTLNSNAQRAYQLSLYWKTIDYPIFKRLVLFSMEKLDIFTKEYVFDYLVEHNCANMWNGDLKCERFSLFSTMVGNFTPVDWERLIDNMIHSKSNFNEIEKEYLYWILRDLSELGIQVKYPEVCSQFVGEYQNVQRSDWQKYFSSYMDGCHWVGENSDYTTQELVLMPPDKLHEVLTRGEPHKLEERLCAFKDGLKTNVDPVINLAEYLFREKKWDAYSLWRTFFNYAKDEVVWSKFSNMLVLLPDKLGKECLRTITGWFRDVTKNIVTDQEDQYWLFYANLEKQVINCGNESITISNDPLSQSINSPIGHIAESLIHRVYARKLKVGALIPEKIKLALEKLLSTENEEINILTGVILSWHLYNIFLIDRGWAKRHVITNMNFSQNEKMTRALWIGYFYNLTYSVDLIAELREPLLSAIENKDTFLFQDGNSGRVAFKNQLIEFYILSLLYCPEVFEQHSSQKVISSFSKSELEQVAFALFRCLSSSSTPDDFWKTNLYSWILTNFPQTDIAKSREITRYFIQLLFCLDKEFVEAFNFLKPYLVKIIGDAYLILDVIRSHEKAIIKYPTSCLELLGSIIDVNGRNAGLKDVLGLIENADQNLSESNDFKSLSKIAGNTDRYC